MPNTILPSSGYKQPNVARAHNDRSVVQPISSFKRTKVDKSAVRNISGYKLPIVARAHNDRSIAIPISAFRTKKPSNPLSTNRTIALLPSGPKPSTPPPTKFPVAPPNPLNDTIHNLGISVASTLPVKPITVTPLPLLSSPDPILPLDSTIASPSSYPKPSTPPPTITPPPKSLVASLNPLNNGISPEIPIPPNSQPSQLIFSSQDPMLDPIFSLEPLPPPPTFTFDPLPTTHLSPLSLASSFSFAPPSATQPKAELPSDVTSVMPHLRKHHNKLKKLASKFKDKKPSLKQPETHFLTTARLSTTPASKNVQTSTNLPKLDPGYHRRIKWKDAANLAQFSSARQSPAPDFFFDQPSATQPQAELSPAMERLLPEHRNRLNLTLNFPNVPTPTNPPKPDPTLTVPTTTFSGPTEPEGLDARLVASIAAGKKTPEPTHFPALPSRILPPLTVTTTKVPASAEPVSPGIRIFAQPSDNQPASTSLPLFGPAISIATLLKSTEEAFPSAPSSPATGSSDSLLITKSKVEGLSPLAPATDQHAEHRAEIAELQRQSFVLSSAKPKQDPSTLHATSASSSSSSMKSTTSEPIVAIANGLTVSSPSLIRGSSGLSFFQEEIDSEGRFNRDPNEPQSLFFQEIPDYFSAALAPEFRQLGRPSGFFPTPVTPTSSAQTERFSQQNPSQPTKKPTTTAKTKRIPRFTETQLMALTDKELDALIKSSKLLEQQGTFMEKASNAWTVFRNLIGFPKDETPPSRFPIKTWRRAQLANKALPPVATLPASVNPTSSRSLPAPVPQHPILSADFERDVTTRTIAMQKRVIAQNLSVPAPVSPSAQPLPSNIKKKDDTLLYNRSLKTGRLHPVVKKKPLITPSIIYVKPARISTATSVSSSAQPKPTLTERLNRIKDRMKRDFTSAISQSNEVVRKAAESNRVAIEKTDKVRAQIQKTLAKKPQHTNPPLRPASSSSSMSSTSAAGHSEEDYNERIYTFQPLSHTSSTVVTVPSKPISPNTFASFSTSAPASSLAAAQRQPRAPSLRAMTQSMLPELQKLRAEYERRFPKQPTPAVLNTLDTSSSTLAPRRAPSSNTSAPITPPIVTTGDLDDSRSTLDSSTSTLAPRRAASSSTSAPIIPPIVSTEDNGILDDSRSTLDASSSTLVPRSASSIQVPLEVQLVHNIVPSSSSSSMISSTSKPLSHTMSFSPADPFEQEDRLVDATPNDSSNLPPKEEVVERGLRPAPTRTNSARGASPEVVAQQLRPAPTRTNSERGSSPESHTPQTWWQRIFQGTPATQPTSPRKTWWSGIHSRF